jgi:hypothetical protein
MATSDFSGMTVNERLYAAGPLVQFDAAAPSRDDEEMVRLLKQVELSVEQAEETSQAVLADPGKYG